MQRVRDEEKRQIIWKAENRVIMELMDKCDDADIFEGLEYILKYLWIDETGYRPFHWYELMDD